MWLRTNIFCYGIFQHILYKREPNQLCHHEGLINLHRSTIIYVKLETDTSSHQEKRAKDYSI